MELEKQLVSTKNITVLNKEHEAILGLVEKELSQDKYNSIVTMDNYKDMKSTGTGLNKISKFINDFRKTKVKLETEDIEIFKSNCKIYDNLIQAKREAILKGLAVFEEETKKQVAKVCHEYEQERIKEIGLREDFFDIDVFSMTQTGYMTANGAISKKGRDEVDRRLNEKLALQNKVDLRLSNLENECLKAGIAILSKEHIQGFLLDDDESYNSKLNALIEIEIKRANAEKAKIEQKAKIKAEQQAKAKVLVEQKALKAELEARYLGQIENADLPTLTKINLELQSYDINATYELKQKCNDRQKELETPNKNETLFDDTQQTNHIKDIAKEETWTAKNANKERWESEKKPVNGKIERTLSIKIKVPETATKEQVVNAVTKMIKEDKLSLNSFEMV